jgi:dUTP pyrophosphatase
MVMDTGKLIVETVATLALGITSTLPYRRYPGDCGYDLFVAKAVTIPVGEFRDVPTNIRCQMPLNTWGLIIGRSSTFRKRRLLVVPGIIDNGYRGELFTGVFNMNKHEAVVEAGERLAQFILMPLVTPEVVFGEVDDTDRGSKGFGSTGQ